MQLKVLQSLRLFHPFMIRNFDFQTKNLERVFDCLNANDKVMFNCNHTNLFTDEYYESWIRQSRHMLLNEKPETLTIAQKRHKKFYVINFVLKSFFVCLFCIILIALIARLLM